MADSDLLIGQTLSHYRIVEKLGQGGMGVVWKAHDTHLDRFVALKTLPAEKLADLDRKHRFVKEAKSASALNHPNIVHIYDIAESGDVPFIAMEYVAGKTLDQRIGRKGLQLNEALKYAVQIADALATAHAGGIVHRDLKPSNLIVSNSGLVKVVDFGLAKLTEKTASDVGETETLGVPASGTEEGTIVGTIAYMFPGTGRRQGSGRAQRYIFPRICHVRNGYWQMRFSRRVQTVDALGHPQERTKPNQQPHTRCAARFREGDIALFAERSGTTFSAYG
jgi:serine/threonine protein kinase